MSWNHRPALGPVGPWISGAPRTGSRILGRTLSAPKHQALAEKFHQNLESSKNLLQVLPPPRCLPWEEAGPGEGSASSQVPPLPLPDNWTLTTCLEVPWLAVSFALWGLFWKRTPELGPSIPMDANCSVGWCLDQEIIGIVQPQGNLDKRWWEPHSRIYQEWTCHIYYAHLC